MKKRKTAISAGLAALLVSASAAPAHADLAGECGATDLASYFENTPRDDAAKIGGGLAYTFDARELGCLERVRNGINPTHYGSAEPGVSYMKLQFKLVSFQEGISEDQLRLSLAKFVRRFFYRKGKVNTLDIEVKSGATIIGEENIFSVSYSDKGQMTDYSAIARFEAGLSPWVPVTETGRIEFLLKGHAASTPELKVMSTLIETSKQLASLQTSPTRVLSKLTEPSFQGFARDLEARINAQLPDERDFSPAIEIKTLGSANDPAGMYFELVDIPEKCLEDPNSRACRRSMPSGPIKPMGGVIIYPVYQNSLLATPEQVIPDTKIPQILQEAAKIRALDLGPLGVEGWASLTDYLKNEQEILQKTLTDRNASVEDFEDSCRILENFIAGDTGLQRYDRAATIWAFLQPTPFYSRTDARYRSRCPEQRTLTMIKTLKLEEPELGALITEADVERGVKVVEDAIYDLASNRGSPEERRRRARDRFNPRVKTIKIMDRGAIITNGPVNDRDEVKVPLGYAVNEYLDRIARKYPQTCSSTLKQILVARGDQPIEGINIAYILLSTVDDSKPREFANMSIDLRATTLDVPAVSISALPLEDIRTLRDEYPGCTAEAFPLPGDVGGESEHTDRPIE